LARRAARRRTAPAESRPAHRPAPIRRSGAIASGFPPAGPTAPDHVPRRSPGLRRRRVARSCRRRGAQIGDPFAGPRRQQHGGQRRGGVCTHSLPSAKPGHRPDVSSGRIAHRTCRQRHCPLPAPQSRGRGSDRGGASCVDALRRWHARRPPQDAQSQAGVSRRGESSVSSTATPPVATLRSTAFTSPENGARPTVRANATAVPTAACGGMSSQQQPRRPNAQHVAHRIGRGLAHPAAPAPRPACPRAAQRRRRGDVPPERSRASHRRQRVQARSSNVRAPLEHGRQQRVSCSRLIRQCLFPRHYHRHYSPATDSALWRRGCATRIRASPGGRGMNKRDRRGGGSSWRRRPETPR